MLLTAIAEAIQDNPIASAFTIPALYRYIARAMRLYSQWNPLIKDKTLATVIDQKEYTVTATCIGVYRCLWYPGSTITSDLTISQQILASQVYVTNEPSLSVIHDINESESLRRLQGKWEWREANRRLVLEPTPTGSGDDITVTYADQHVLNVGGTGYDTIPDEDLEIVRDLCLAEILDGKAMEFAIQPDYRSGAEQETLHFVPGNARDLAELLRSNLANKYGRSVGMIT